MIHPTCPRCGAPCPLKGRSATIYRKWCSDECAQDIKHAFRRDACAGCGTPLAPNRGMPRRWCSEVCRVGAYRRANLDACRSKGRQQSRRLRAANPDLKRKQRACAGCGVSLAGQRGPHTHCAPCRAAAREQARPAERACRVCGVIFQPLTANHFLCSSRACKQAPKTARNRRRRARQRQATVVVFDEHAIFERDGWRCHLCGGRIDRRTKFPHPRSASLDHVVPLARGGGHSPNNLRCAHLGCNSRKGDRAVGEQLLLIG